MTRDSRDRMKSTGMDLDPGDSMKELEGMPTRRVSSSQPSPQKPEDAVPFYELEGQSKTQTQGTLGITSRTWISCCVIELVTKNPNPLLDIMYERVRAQTNKDGEASSQVKESMNTRMLTI